MAKNISISGTMGAFVTVIGALVLLGSLPFFYLPGIAIGGMMFLVGLLVK